MMRLLMVVILLGSFWLTGCSEKDKKDEIQALGQEAAKDQAAAVIDSLDRVAAQRAGKEPLDRQPAVAVPDSGEEAETMAAETAVTETTSESQPEMTSSEGEGVEISSNNLSSETQTSDSGQGMSETTGSEPQVSSVEAIAAGVGGFVVQIGSYNSEKLAQKMLKKYQNGQYPLFIRTVEMDSRTIYRLRIGGYQTREEAKTVGEKFKNEFSVDYWVTAND